LRRRKGPEKALSAIEQSVFQMIGGSSALLNVMERSDKLPIITLFFQRFPALGAWLFDLFNAPPLESLTHLQKIGRVFLLTATLIIGSILVAMVGALGLFLVEQGSRLFEGPGVLNGLVILSTGIAVNVACVWVLLQIKRADNSLVPPPDPSSRPGGISLPPG
jgi:uncharacterized membrane protein YidH (DUF202 family)